ncbi:MAG: polysaccharide biosynthesis/export family protein [Cryomorphaceae bacterium]|nr:polysaccharide biosynthesis/export family protein [Cryomorphaceae bacterium]
MTVRFSFILLIALFGLGSCKTHNIFWQKNANNTVEDLDSVFLYDEGYQYHIRKDDKITISVWGQDDLSVGSSYGIYNSNEVYGKWLMVDSRGNIEVPKLGTLKVENKTIIELKEELRVHFGEWVRNPIVDIKVLNREITILGEVRDPQVINVDKEKNTLIEIIARCKGFEFYAEMRYIKVFRQVGENVHVANIDLTKSGDYHLKNINLHPGDVVVVPSKKHKNFDRRIATVIPFSTTLTAAAIFMGALL